MTKRERDRVLRGAIRNINDAMKNWRGAEGKYASSTQTFKDWCAGADMAIDAVEEIIATPLKQKAAA